MSDDAGIRIENVSRPVLADVFRWSVLAALLLFFIPPFVGYTFIVGMMAPPFILVPFLIPLVSLIGRKTIVKDRPLTLLLTVLNTLIAAVIVAIDVFHLVKGPPQFHM